jgi:hypothetical protein
MATRSWIIFQLSAKSEQKRSLFEGRQWAAKGAATFRSLPINNAVRDGRPLDADDYTSVRSQTSYSHQDTLA